MCIANRLNKEEFERYVKTLPKELKVYKVMAIDGTTAYGFTRLSGRRKVYHARNEPAYKSRIPYKPGFHSYRSRKSAENHKHGWQKVRGFKIKREWITEIGIYRGDRCFVTSKIQTL